MSSSLTLGVHHVGLAVPDIDAASDFFLEVLGWDMVGGVADYPALFVSDGRIMVTLWRVANPATAVAFDRRANIGLHHLALAVADEAALLTVFDRARVHPHTVIEFSPQPMREGSTTLHFICSMPGGPRIEFTTLRS